MDISKKSDYTVALVTENVELSVSTLREKVSAVFSFLKEKDIMPFDRVVVFLEDRNSLLAVLWALQKRAICCILVEDRLSREVSLAEISRKYEAKYIITEQCHWTSMGSDGSPMLESLIISGLLPYCIRTSPDQNIPFIFHSTKGDCPTSGIMDKMSWDALFKELDGMVDPGGSDILLIEDNVPFFMRVLEMLWASSRGITIVLDSLKGKRGFGRYMKPEKRIGMRFGLFHFGSYIEKSASDKYGLLFDTVRFADKNGFDAVWTPERHFNEFGGLFPNPSVLSAALAVSTSQVQIRSGSLVSPLHHPVRIAEDWSLVDNLSNGRVGISFASGWQCDDFIFFPEYYQDRHQRMMDEIEMVRQLWTGRKLRFKNGLGKDIDVEIFPKPVQKELPVWITVSGRTATFVDAGKIGANILTHLLWQDTDELIEKIAAYRQSLQDNGYDPYSRTVTVMVHTCLGEDNDSIKETVKEPLKNYIRSSTQLIQSMVKSNIESSNAKDVGGRYGGLDNEIEPHLMDELVEIAFNRFFEQAGLLGTIGKAKALIMKLKSYDVDEIAALIDFGISREDILKGLFYLNELRKEHDTGLLSGYPVTISHCSLATLTKAKNDPELSAFLDMQNSILTDDEKDAGLEGQIPSHLTQKVKIIRHSVGDDDTMRTSIQSISPPTGGKMTFFNSLISDEF